MSNSSNSSNHPKKQRRLLTPRVYEVGTDISVEHHAILLAKLTDFLAQTRNTKAPSLLAKQIVDACLKGVKPSDGKTPWFSAANTKFAVRIKQACNFDMSSPNPDDWAAGKSKSFERRVKRDREAERGERKARKAMEDPLLPDEVRAGLKKQVNYGDNVLLLLSHEEEKRWWELFNDFQNEHPHLKLPSAEAELGLLCSLLVAQSRFQLQLLSGKKEIDEIKFGKIVEQIPKIKSSLNIHPDQINRRKEKAKAQSIGDAVAKFEGMEDWREIRLKYWAQEIIQSIQMFNQPRADGNGYQLDETGFWGLHRCGTCECSKCGQRNVRGLNYDEVERYAIGKGLIEEDEDTTDEDNTDEDNTSPPGEEPASEAAGEAN
jgi:hypothetical protein